MRSRPSPRIKCCMQEVLHGYVAYSIITFCSLSTSRVIGIAAASSSFYVHFDMCRLDIARWRLYVWRENRDFQSSFASCFRTVRFDDQDCQVWDTRCSICVWRVENCNVVVSLCFWSIAPILLEHSFAGDWHIRRLDRTSDDSVGVHVQVFNVSITLCLSVVRSIYFS